MTAQTTEITGMRAFYTVWAGQLVSVIGTTITGFALQIWIFLETGSVLNMAMVMLAVTLPATILSPFAGALVDRWDRRIVMIGADLLAAVSTVLIAVFHFTGTLEIWHLFLTAGLGAIGNAFQSPAWLAAMPTIVPKNDLERANGLVQMNDGVSIIIGPAIAGAILGFSGLGAILILDLVTFAVAVTALIAVRFPRPERAGNGEPTNLAGEVRSGWAFIRDRKGLLGLLGIYSGVNFVMSFSNVLFFPLILSIASAQSAGYILSIGGFGLVATSLVIGTRGGFSNRIASITGGIAIIGLMLAVMGLRANVVLISIGIFVVFTTMPIINTPSQVLWQLKVPLEMQGRVFALRRTLASALAPIAILLAGPLADNVFEPMMDAGGSLAGSVGTVIGTGPGRGIALMVIISGLLTAGLALLAWLLPRIRHIETELPDYLPDTPGDEAGEPDPAAETATTAEA